MEEKKNTMFRRLRLKVCLRLTFVYLGILLVGLAVFQWLLPGSYFNAYPLIGLTFWIMGMVLNDALFRARFRTPEKITNIFITYRAFKLIITVIGIITAGLMLQEHKISFLVSVVVNYFAYMVIELYIFYMYTKRLKMRFVNYAKIRNNK